MSKLLKVVFPVHAVVAAVSGALLLIIPGRSLQWVDWAPIDPILTRVLGAALLGLAWSSLRGWRAREWREVAILVEAEAAFTILGAVGVLRHLVTSTWPVTVWVLFGVLAAFALAWVVAWFMK